MSISLDTPEQINAWVLLSRISQCHIHMNTTMKVPGLASWMKANVPDVTNERTVKDMYPRLLDYCDTLGVQAPGGEQCNYQILMTGGPLTGLYFDYGIVDSMTEVEANPTWVKAYAENRLVIMRTMEPVRDRDRTIQMVRG
jgi:hypothetical protein